MQRKSLNPEKRRSFVNKVRGQPRVGWHPGMEVGQPFVGSYRLSRTRRTFAHRVSQHRGSKPKQGKVACLQKCFLEWVYSLKISIHVGCGQYSIL